MSDTKFDPYHVWLGIPPKDQPPNLYRLLGLELYESDAQVIDAAANRHTSYLQMMAAGKQRKQSQELLNEIASARRRLLDADRKKKYDEKLKAEQGEKAAADQKADASSVPVPLPDSESSTTDAAATADSPEVRRLTGADATGSFSAKDIKKAAAADAKKRKQASVAGSLKKKDAASTAKLQVLLGGGVLLALCIIAGFVIWGGDEEEAPGGTTAGTEEHSAEDNTGTGQEGTGKSGTDPADEHLFAHWAFDDESLDLASVSNPNAMAATVLGAPKIVAGGPIGSYLQLDGKKDWLQLPPTVINLKEGAIAGWFRVQDPPDRKSSLVLRIRQGDQRLDIRRNQDGGLHIANPAQEWTLTATRQAPLGEWFHLALAWTDSAPAAVYLNGSQCGVSEKPLTMPSCNGILAGTGSPPKSPPGKKKKKNQQTHVFYKLSIDDLRFYGQPLDEAKIRKLLAASSITPATLKPYEVVKPPTITVGADGLVAQYSFEDAAKPELDKSGNATGTNHGAKVIDDPAVGKALDLNGTSSYVEVPRIVANDFTIAFWLKAPPDQAQVAERIGLVDASAPGNAADFRSMLNKGLVAFEVGDADEKAKKLVQSKKPVTDGNWHYIAMSRSAANGKLSLFVDGELQAQADGPKGPRSDSETMRLGRIQNEKRFLKGQIADLRIHQQVLPPAKLTQLGGKPLAAMFEAKRKAHAATIAAKVSELRTTPAGKNQILCEYWRDIPGKAVKPVKDKANAKATPDGVRFLSRLSANMPESLGDNYGQKLTGYLLPPKSGSYVFEALFDDSGEFLLSTSGNAKDLKPVKEARQLKAGQAYYFQVFHKEEGGDDAFAINWTIPGEKKSVVSGTHLTSIPGYHRFTSMTPASASAASNAVKLKINPDKSILASGESRDGVYTIDLNSNISDFTSLRLEILPDASLIGGGPGMGALGMFAVQDIDLSIVEGSRVSKVELSEPASREGIPKSAADGDDKTTWSVRRRSSELPQAVALFLTPVSPVKLNPNAKLRLTIRQSTNIGRFRISGTAMDAATLAGEIARASVPVDRVPKRKMKPLLVNLNGHTIENPKTKERWVAGREFKGAATWGYKGGAPVGNKNDKSSTLPNAIQGIQSFHAKVENGAYTVSLFFTDHWANLPGERQFTVQIEKPSIGGRIDPILQGGGKGKPSSLSKVVRVEDGSIDILFTRVKGEPILNAIRIEPK